MTKSSDSPTIKVYRLPTDRPAPYWGSVDDASLTIASQHLQKCFDDLLTQDKKLAEYSYRMKLLDLEVVIFGGWIRDRLIELFHGRPSPSRDIDLVTHGAISVKKALAEPITRNPFGGFGVEASQLHLDAWDLPNTFLIKRHKLPISFDQLPFTADYNINAVVFKPAQFFETSSLIDAGAIYSIQNGVLDFAADEVAQPLVQAARSIILATRLKLIISETIQAFLKAVCSTKTRHQTVINGIRNYCPAELEDKAVLLFTSITGETYEH